ncbi:hypothetical protein K1T71_003968 [Dendrolimus kikuchii]|uniref:Uncharacterized protein n=1 Tax=Dendrolimus kikuchii TaxID=765133 RepID=A0ACC1D9W7_9NEOP|nr:hypothetical protein K1T71_003968 [Dendrolimus kikuchii]
MRAEEHLSGTRICQAVVPRLSLRSLKKRHNSSFLCSEYELDIPSWLPSHKRVEVTRTHRSTRTQPLSLMAPRQFGICRLMETRAVSPDRNSTPEQRSASYLTRCAGAGMDAVWVTGAADPDS